MTKTTEYQALLDQAARAERKAFGDGAIIVCDNLVKIYKIADLEVVALQGLDLVVERGEFVAIVGSSGSGKSTLLNILGGLDTPSAGHVKVAGFDLLDIDHQDRTRYRREVIGFVWQQTARNLLPYLTAAQNVEMPLILTGAPSAFRRSRVKTLLEVVGLADRRHHRPEELSGGEQQRVAIATALSNSPEILFADEPTGELDTKTSSEVFEVMRRVNQTEGITIVVVTHDPLVAEHVTRTVAIRDGRTSSEVVRRTQISDLGEHQIVAEEFAVLDRVGRLQLPADYVDALDLRRRVRLALEADHISIWPDRPATTDDPEDEE
ncbi:MAG: ABC transporter ATP-binding protein [Acidimicrobiia bacterium]